MALTAAQTQALKADLAANANVVLVNGVAVPVNAVPHGSQNADTVAGWYNLTASPAFLGYYSAVPVDVLMGAISWRSLTPQDPVPTDTALNVEVWSARALACQGEVLNLQTMLSGRATLDSTQANTVQGLRDALSGVPSGPGGAPLDAGWAAIRPALSRPATNAEKLFADVSKGNGSDAAHPANLAPFQGPLSGQDILNAWS